MWQQIEDTLSCSVALDARPHPSPPHPSSTVVICSAGLNDVNKYVCWSQPRTPSATCTAPSNNTGCNFYYSATATPTISNVSPSASQVRISDTDPMRIWVGSVQCSSTDAESPSTDHYLSFAPSTLSLRPLGIISPTAAGGPAADHHRRQPWIGDQGFVPPRQHRRRLVALGHVGLVRLRHRRCAIIARGGLQVSRRMGGREERGGRIFQRARR